MALKGTETSGGPRNNFSSPCFLVFLSHPPPLVMRQLKYHEKKLLKKVNFFEYKKEKNLREIKVIRKYYVQRREDYTK
jgi:hypothetical protein